MAGTGGRHRFGGIETACHDRRQDQVHSSSNRQFRLAGTQALARQVHGNQRRRTCGVDRERRATKVQEIRQPVGDDAQCAAGAGPGVDLVEVARGEVTVLADTRADEDSGLRTLECLGRNAGMLEGLDGHLEKQTLLRIDPVCFARRDGEEIGIEGIDVTQERTEPGRFR